MRVAFDHSAFCRQGYGGVARYFVHLAKGLSELYECDVRIFAPWYLTNYLKELPGSIVEGQFLPRCPKVIKPLIKMGGSVIGRQKIERWGAQIVHETYYASARSASASIPVVTTVYDMIHERFPKEFWPWDRTSANKRRSVARADHVIAISESTRRDLIELFNIEPDRVTTIYLAHERFGNGQISDADTLGPQGRPYLLYVGHRQSYKNFSRFIEAYASSKMLMSDFDVVCFGGGAFTKQESQTLRSLGITGNVRQVSGDDRVLGEYYRQARAFVCPSLYEGFGLPPLEAMAHGAPVVCSNTSSLPEVVGSAGEYFDPYDTASIRKSLEFIAFDELRREVLRTLAKEQLGKFSWARCAEETLAVYRKVCA